MCVFAPLQAPESYKNVTDVVDTCEGPIECAIKFACTVLCPSLPQPVFPSLGHAAGISKKAIKLRPLAVIKG